MADYHVLRSTKDSATVVFHIPTPAGTNFAGKPWSEAFEESLKNSEGGLIASKVPGLAGAEVTAVVAGTLIEHEETVQYDGESSNAAKAAVLDAKWTELNARVPAAIQMRLQFWGLARDVS